MNYFIVVVFALVVGAHAAEGCKDELSMCKQLSDMCYSSDVQALCRATCGKCHTPVETTRPVRPTPPIGPVGGGECGKPDIRGITRVIGGKTAIRGSWPWQILMMTNGQAMCGGTLIAPQWVVTAAHCVYRRENSGAFSVRTGEQDRNEYEGSEATYQVGRVFRHPGYNPRTLNNDIALLKLSTPVTFNKYVKPICLPKNKAEPGSTCFITGWGKIRHPGRMTRFLQQAILPVVSNEACYEKNKDTIPIPITDGMICGGDAGTTSRSGCHGDSGGPYVCKVNGVWELHGAVSHGSPVCSSTQTYTVFARVYHFLTWIKDTMKK